MTGIEWMGLGVAWLAVGMLAAGAFAREKTPEEQARDDADQLRWLDERAFIEAIDAAAKHVGYEDAWQEAAEVGRQDNNIKRWTNEELRRATRLLKRYDQ